MIRAIGLGKPFIVAMISVACVGAVVAIIFPDPIVVILGTVLVVSSVSLLLVAALQPPPPDPITAAAGAVFPDGFKWKQEALMVVGGGNVSDGLLWKERERQDESQEYGSLDSRYVTWPDFRDPKINRLLHSALTGFVLTPVNSNDQIHDYLKGWKHPPDRKEGADVDAAVGGRIWFAPHFAGQASPKQSFERMRMRKDEIQGLIQDNFDNVNGVVHVVSASNSATAFFTQVDVQGIVGATALEYRNHMILYIDDRILPDRVDDYVEATAAEIKLFTERLEHDSQYFPILLTDNRTHVNRKLDHMAIILMLAGASAVAANEGDPYKLLTLASVYAPFVPRKQTIRNMRTRIARQEWANLLASLDPEKWPCLWTGFDASIPAVHREGIVVLMAGDQRECAGVFECIQTALRPKDISASVIIAHVPGAETIWMAACVPLTKSELEISQMAPVFAPLAKPGPEPVETSIPSNEDGLPTP